MVPYSVEMSKARLNIWNCGAPQKFGNNKTCPKGHKLHGDLICGNSYVSSG